MERTTSGSKNAAKDMSFTLGRGVCEQCGCIGLLVKTARYGNLCADRCREKPTEAAAPDIRAR